LLVQERIEVDVIDAAERRHAINLW
jgi:hypothetical protein